MKLNINPQCFGWFTFGSINSKIFAAAIIMKLVATVFDTYSYMGERDPSCDSEDQHILGSAPGTHIKSLRGCPYTAILAQSQILEVPLLQNQLYTYVMYLFCAWSCEGASG